MDKLYNCIRMSHDVRSKWFELWQMRQAAVRPERQQLISVILLRTPKIDK